MTYQRVASGDPGNSGATSAVTVVNAHSAGLEALEGFNGTAVSAASYGVVGDGRVAQITFTGGSTTVSLTANGDWWGATGNLAQNPDWQLTSDDVGKPVAIDKAGGTGPNYGWHRTTIAEVYSATSCRLASAPTRSGTHTWMKMIWGTDNTSAINTAIDALPTGGILIFPPARGFYLTDGNHMVDGYRQTVCGFSMLNTRFVSTHLTNSLFRVQGQFNRLEDFTVLHGAAFTDNSSFAAYLLGTGGDYNERPTAPTAGAGISVEDPAANSVTNKADCHEYHRVQSYGFYRGWDFTGGVWHKMTFCEARGTVAENLRFERPYWNDMGNLEVINCNFGQYSFEYVGGDGGTAGFRWLGGGDTLIQNCHFVGTYNPIYFNPVVRSGGSTPYTSNTRIIGNSFEDTWGTNILFTTSSTPTFDFAYTVVANNTMGPGGGTYPIVFEDPAASTSHVRYGSQAFAFTSVTGNAISSGNIYAQGMYRSQIRGNAVNASAEYVDGGRNSGLNT